MAFTKILLEGDGTSEVQGEATLDLTGDVTITSAGKSLTVNDLRLGTISNIQISSGDITQTGSYHSIEAETAADDQLDGISAGSDGQLLFIRPQDDSETITVAHNQNSAATNNILLNADTSYAMNDIDDYMLLIYDATQDTNGAWVEVSRGQGAVATLSANTPAAVGTVGAAGSGAEASKDDHVHDTAAGFIDNVNKFGSGVVDAAAIAANAVGNSEINNSATDIAFNQIILTEKATGDGTTNGTLFYDSDDDRLKVFIP